MVTAPLLRRLLLPSIHVLKKGEWVPHEAHERLCWVLIDPCGAAAASITTAAACVLRTSAACLFRLLPAVHHM
jgi:hypothetical protein